MRNCKVGQRVVVNASVDKGVCPAREGMVGTVLEDSDVPWVVFDEPTGTNSSNRNISGWKVGHMACMIDDELDLLP